LATATKHGLQNELLNKARATMSNYKPRSAPLTHLYEADLQRLEWIFYGLIGVTLIAGYAVELCDFK
jgi:hypothetical protein